MADDGLRYYGLPFPGFDPAVFDDAPPPPPPALSRRKTVYGNDVFYHGGHMYIVTDDPDPILFDKQDGLYWYGYEQGNLDDGPCDDEPVLLYTRRGSSNRVFAVHQRCVDIREAIVYLERIQDFFKDRD